MPTVASFSSQPMLIPYCASRRKIISMRAPVVGESLPMVETITQALPDIGIVIALIVRVMFKW